MSQRQVVLLFAPLAVLLAASFAAAADGVAESGTFDNSAGETHFALSLKPTVNVPRAAAHDILVMFDTSASQAGVFRDDAMVAFKTMLTALGPNDRVSLMAVDLKAVPMTQGFVAANSPQMDEALAKLEGRAPLGSTDLVVGLKQAAAEFSNDAVNARSIVYIGDGMSRANMLQTTEFAALMSSLVAKRTAVSSYAIGPDRDVSLLAAISNHTGGMLYLDAAQGGTAQNAGMAMADVARANVFWPVKSELPASMTESFPTQIPPLRADREMVLVGRLANRDPQRLAIQAEVNGQTVDLGWSVTAALSNDDYSFLPQLVQSARGNGGVNLPTLGSASLTEFARMAAANANQLTDLGNRALRSGDAGGALNVANAALGNDPNNPQAQALRNAAQAAGNDPDLRMVDLQGGNAPAGGGGLLNEFMQDEGQFLNLVQNNAAVVAQKIQAEVEQQLNDSRTQMGTDPEGAKNELKLLLETIEQLPDLEPEVKAQLADQIETAIREAGRLSFKVNHERQQAEERRAAAEEAQRIVDETARTREKVKQLMARFDSLMDEGRHNQAEDIIADQVRELEPNSPTAVTAIWNARFSGHVDTMVRLREIRHRNFARALLTVEQALVPFPDEPPIAYPEPQVWADLTLRRKKWASVDLARRGGAEEKIFNALNDDTRLEFIDTSLDDVITFLRDNHDIPIEIDVKALDEVGIGTDVAVTRNLKGISLRSALRLMLKDIGLTYVIRDEVLLITTPEEAESQLVTKVYPVGDLVLPITGGAGINPFQMGGGMGGGGGGGMGGGGMGGGGMGGGGMGGGMGGGGGGGFFAVQDHWRPVAK